MLFCMTPVFNYIEFEMRFDCIVLYFKSTALQMLNISAGESSPTGRSRRFLMQHTLSFLITISVKLLW